MKAPESDLRQAIKKIKSEYRPEKIILFGSRAKGEVDQESDANLLSSGAIAGKLR